MNKNINKSGEIINGKIYYSNYRDFVEKQLNEQGLELVRAENIGGWLVAGSHYETLDIIVNDFCLEGWED